MPEGKTVKSRDELETPKNNVYRTTPGRVRFNDILPEGLHFYNYTLDKKDLQDIVADCHQTLGLDATLKLLDDMKDMGFKEATMAGLSFTVTDLRPSSYKEKIIERTSAEVTKVEKAYQKGVITEGERYNQIIDRWVHATEEVGEDMMKQLATDMREGKRYLNPIYLMVKSGARGSLQQVRQLAGMRGLMAKPSGKIIETPIRANFREGLRVCEYFSSTHGARKGLADTALKTADSGYLTRKLADVAQNVVVVYEDCGTLSGITKGAVRRGDKLEVGLAQTIRGRTARNAIVNVVTDEVIVD
jgi:DNA-directed RNA polymerase subunit beta'